MKLFLRGILAVLITGGSLLFLVSNWIELSSDQMTGIIAGIVLASVFVSSGFFSSVIALKKQQNLFSRIFIISFIGRMILITMLIVLVLKFFLTDKPVFLITLFVFYFLFQILEVISFNKMAVKGN